MLIFVRITLYSADYFQVAQHPLYCERQNTGGAVLLCCVYIRSNRNNTKLNRAATTRRALQLAERHLHTSACGEPSHLFGNSTLQRNGL